VTTGDPHTSGLEQSVAAWRQWAAWGLLAVVAVTAVVALAWTAVHAAAAHSAASRSTVSSRPVLTASSALRITVEGDLPTRAPAVASSPAAASAARVRPAVTAPRQVQVQPPAVAAQSRPPAAPPPPPPPPPRNMLISADGTLSTGVGVYSDCTGQAPVPRTTAAIDTCIGGVTYFDGHNPGVFTPLMHMGPGAVITWYDNSAASHRLRIVSVRQWVRTDGPPPLATDSVVAQFQTCVADDGSIDRILDAVPA